MIYKEIKEYFEKEKIPSFRFKQLIHAVFKEHVSSFNDITVFPKWLRENLSQKFSLPSLAFL